MYFHLNLSNGQINTYVKLHWCGISLHPSFKIAHLSFSSYRMQGAFCAVVLKAISGIYLARYCLEGCSSQAVSHYRRKNKPKMESNFPIMKQAVSYPCQWSGGSHNGASPPQVSWAPSLLPSIVPWKLRDILWLGNKKTPPVTWSATLW